MKSWGLNGQGNHLSRAHVPEMKSLPGSGGTKSQWCYGSFTPLTVLDTKGKVYCPGLLFPHFKLSSKLQQSGQKGKALRTNIQMKGQNWESRCKALHLQPAPLSTRVSRQLHEEGTVFRKLESHMPKNEAVPYLTPQAEPEMD